MSPKRSDASQSSQVLSHDLHELLVAGKIATQEDIRAALEAAGHVMNQSKISRLLRKMGAIKSKNELGQIVYRLPHEPAPPTVSSQIASLLIDIVANETVIIVTTSPGSAQLVARILDYHKKNLYMLGSIAGDDTILVIPHSIKMIDTAMVAMRKLLLL